MSLASLVDIDLVVSELCTFNLLGGATPDAPSYGNPM